MIGNIYIDHKDEITSIISSSSLSSSSSEGIATAEDVDALLVNLLSSSAWIDAANLN